MYNSIDRAQGHACWCEVEAALPPLYPKLSAKLCQAEPLILNLKEKRAKIQHGRTLQPFLVLLQRAALPERKGGRIESKMS